MKPSRQLHRKGGEATPPSNARLIAELQAASIAIRLFGLDKLPDVMVRANSPEGGE